MVSHYVYLRFLHLVVHPLITSQGCRHLSKKWFNKNNGIRFGLSNLLLWINIRCIYIEMCLY